MEEYQIRKLTIKDREQFLDCFNEGIPFSRKDRSDFDWQYVNNPAGIIVGFGAFSDQKLVAVYVVSPVRFKIGNEIVLGAQSMDTLTLPCAQKKGLFKTLATQTYKTLTHEGLVKFTYGFPNQNSKHGFIKHLNWTLFDPCCTLIRILNTSCINRKIKLPFELALPLPLLPIGKRKYHTAQVEKLPNELDILWQKFQKTFNVGIVRNETYLRWRFEMKPKVKYNYFEVRTIKGELEGIGIMRIIDKEQGRIAYLMEFITSEGNKRAMTELLHFMMKRARQEKVEIMVTRIMRDNPFCHLFIKQGFFPLPWWLQSTKVCPGYVIHDVHFQSIVRDQRKWHISYADDDTM